MIGFDIGEVSLIVRRKVQKRFHELSDARRLRNVGVVTTEKGEKGQKRMTAGRDAVTRREVESLKCEKNQTKSE